MGLREGVGRVQRRAGLRDVLCGGPTQRGEGSVVEERESSPTWILGRVRVRFDGWSARFDEW